MTLNKIVRLIAVVGLAFSGLFGLASAASAQTNAANCLDVAASDVGGGGGNANPASTGDNCNNSGDVEGNADQSGSASTGDGVAGQVAGVVSAGDASVDATNRSDDVEVSTGDASATNAADLRASGIDFNAPGGTVAADCLSVAASDVGGGGGNNNPATTGVRCQNDGDVEGNAGQSADAASGDGVGGQVIGVVTSAGGSADLVLDNESTDSDVDTGDGTQSNAAATDDAGIHFTV